MYKKETVTYDVWARDIWDLGQDLLRDPYLVSQMEFDSHKLSKFDGNQWVGFVDEPMTAKAFWEMQVCES